MPCLICCKHPFAAASGSLQLAQHSEQSSSGARPPLSATLSTISAISFVAPGPAYSAADAAATASAAAAATPQHHQQYAQGLVSVGKVEAVP